MTCVCDAHVVFYIIFSPINLKNVTYCSTHFLQELTPGLSELKYVQFSNLCEQKKHLIIRIFC